MSALPARSIRALSRQWSGRLAHFRNHHNDEHREALVTEAMRFVGLNLEDALSASSYWSQAPLARRVAVLLYLVDRGAVVRVAHKGRIVFEATPEAETWASSQPALAPYLTPTLEMLAALRQEQAGRAADAE